jgi:putative Ig domain-containing protein/matrixin
LLNVSLMKFGPVRFFRRLFPVCFVGFLALLGASENVRAFAPLGYTWPEGSQVSIHLQLNRPAVALQDGSASWNDSAADALALWNQYLGSIQLVADSPTGSSGGNGFNEVFFANTVYGDTWPTGVLAVTLNHSEDGTLFAETDVLFNNNLKWNSYRGFIQGGGATGTWDLHRVALHEFGHVLGLDHPDENAQHVTAIMNSIIGDLDHLTDDDIAGATSLYGLHLTSAASATGVSGQAFTFQLTANQPDVSFSCPDLPAGLILNSSTGLISGTPANGGTFVIHITLSRNGRSVMASMTLNIKAAPRAIDGPTGFAISGEEMASPVGPNSFYYTPADGTFTVTGTPDNPNNPAFGTSVTFNFTTGGETWNLKFTAPRGVPLTVGRYEGLNDSGPLSHSPALELIRNSAGSGGPGGYFEVKSIAYGTNNQVLSFDATFEMFVAGGSPMVRGEARFSWDASNPPATPAITSPLALQVGKGLAINYKITATNAPTRFKVYQLPAGLSFDPATATITGIPATTGFFEIVLGAENSAGTGTGRLNLIVSAAPPPHTLQNIATRLLVGSSADVAIAGVIVTGSNSKRMVIRGIAPSLSAVGVNGVLPDPQLDFRNGNGDVSGSNDNWLSDWEVVHQTGIQPSDKKESAVVTTVSPGPYTAIMKGVGAGGLTGVGLIEVYDLDPGSGSRLANISTRGQVKTGENVMIGGFIIGGGQPTKVIVRGMGPSLTSAGVTGVLSDPMLELHDANGGVVHNDDWRESDEMGILATGLPPSDDREAAIVQTLAPGNYTSILSGKGNTTGVGLIEIYNLEPN